jgi:hypothetical protein
MKNFLKKNIIAFGRSYTISNRKKCDFLWTEVTIYYISNVGLYNRGNYIFFVSFTFLKYFILSFYKRLLMLDSK